MPPDLGQLLADGRLIDLIIWLTAAEGIFLVAYHWRTGRGLSPPDVLANLLAGVCLLLAVRAALVGAAWGWVAAALAAALVAHLADLSRRWRRVPAERSTIAAECVPNTGSLVPTEKK